ATATLVVSVTANSTPTAGSYPDTTVAPAGGVTVTPTVAPSDNGSIVSVTAVATPATFSGSFSGDASSGSVTITGANPPGVYNVSVTLTDNCNYTATRSFMLMVGSCNASLSKSHESFAAKA